MPKYLFIDANIYLDFYRIRNEIKASFLEHLEAIRDSLIITDQVEMEFKKNRQSAILEGMKELKMPSSICVPGVLKEDKTSKALDGDIRKISTRMKKLKDRLHNVFEYPSRYDKVYQALQRLFAKKQEIDLYRKNKKRYEIRELAQKRFMLGYPPRKKNDTSMGDAINWEWLVHIGKIKHCDILVVSRDNDYGTIQGGVGFINDWLKQEYRERVNKKRKVTLCPQLSVALKEFKIKVTPEEEKEEKRVIELSVHCCGVSITSSPTLDIVPDQECDVTPQT